MAEMLKPDQQRKSQHRTNRCISTVMKALRVFQFLMVLPIFAFAIYMMAMESMPISALACILLIVLTGAYIFVMAVDLIGQFAGAGASSHIVPMFVFSLLGVILFGAAGVLLAFNVYTEHAAQIGATVLCLLAALIFLIDVTLVLAYWKRRCSVCKRCCSSEAIEILVPRRRSEEPRVVSHEKRDLTTSVSDVRLPPGTDDAATADHSYRKIEQPRRRQYVDCPTCVPSLCGVDVAQIQTEPRMVRMTESQTPETVTRETPMQTLSRCEFCQRQLLSPLEDTAPPCLQQPSQWTACPAIVQFVRGGISVPCCPGCKCATGTTQTQRQQQQQLQSQQQQQRSTPERANWRTLERDNGTLTSSVNATNNDTKFTGVAENVTKLTLASFYVKPNARIQSGREDASTSKRKVDVTETKENEKGERSDNGNAVVQDVDRELARKAIETTALVARKEPEEPEIVDKIIVQCREERVERKAPSSKRESTVLKRNSAEGLLAARKSVEREESTEYKTQITPSSSRSKPKTLLHLKSNKVDPIDDADAPDESRAGRRAENVASRPTSVSQAAQGDELSESSNAEDQMKDICSLCRRQKNAVPTSDNSRYYTVFKDRKGRYFCEFCAPLDSKKVTSRIEVSEFKKLRCVNCRLSLRGRGSVGSGSAAPRSDTCPKCGQTQRYVASPSFT